MYVNKEDYNGISPELLDMLLGEDDNERTATLQKINKEVTDTIRAHLGALHDIDTELAKEGDARNGYILRMAVRLAVYEVYLRADDEEVPKKIIKNQDDTMEELQKISIGKGVSLSLGGEEEESGGGAGGEESIQPGGKGLRRIGSQPRRTHRP